MTSLKLLRLLKDELETPYVVSYFFNGLLGTAQNRCLVVSLRET